MTAKKKMTEAQAWGYLARQWAKAERNGVIYVGSGREQGVCMSIDWLARDRRVLAGVKQKMVFRMQQNSVGIRWDGFWWPRNVRGAGKRAIFCKRMAGYAAVDEKLDRK